ncbi:6-O-methylguanine DNA methyltransferase [Aspergillus spectabilis]
MPQPASDMGSNCKGINSGGPGLDDDPQSGPHEIECNSSPLNLQVQPPPRIKSNTHNVLHNNVSKDNKEQPRGSPSLPIPDVNPNPAPPAPPAPLSNPTQSPEKTKIAILTKKIKTHPTLSPLRKRTYLLLLTVPRGHWTTYSALSKKLNSSPRAVGTAMRLNPFAPDVPCHRVLGVGGLLGGYMGTKPNAVTNGEGKGLEGNLGRKRQMLEDEGVRFDERGRALRGGFVGFT